nr:MAG TPA: hypothetical protein [Caudoviricetes sp.]
MLSRPTDLHWWACMFQNKYQRRRLFPTCFLN